MPRILIAEVIQVLTYAIFFAVFCVTRLDGLLYFAFGFVLAVGIPSVLLGYGFNGIKPSMPVGDSKYERFRGLPIANAIWGMFHLLLALAIFINIKEKFRPGFNLETFLIIIGFCLIYFLTSMSQNQKMEV